MASHWDGRFDFDHNFDSDATLVDSDNKNLDHTRGTLFSWDFLYSIILMIANSEDNFKDEDILDF